MLKCENKRWHEFIITNWEGLDHSVLKRLLKRCPSGFKIKKLNDRCSIVYVVYIRLTFRYHFIVIPIFRSANPIICLPIYLSIYLPIYLSFSDYESHRPSANWAFSLKRISEAAQQHRLVFKDWVLKMGTPPLPPSMRSITLISLKRYELPTNRVLGC